MCVFNLNHQLYLESLNKQPVNAFRYLQATYLHVMDELCAFVTVTLSAEVWGDLAMLFCSTEMNKALMLCIRALEWGVWR